MVRNPVKFLHVVNFSLLVVFAYGIDDLWRRYLQPPAASNAPARGNRGLVGSSPFVRQALGTGVRSRFRGQSARVVGYASASHSLEGYLRAVQFDEANAIAISAFSICQAGLFLPSLGGYGGLMLYVLRGAFAGWAQVGCRIARRALGCGPRTCRPPVDHLLGLQAEVHLQSDHRQTAREALQHRVEMLPFSPPSKYALLGQLYQGEWLKHQFPYYNIQSLDVVQMPRTLADVAAYGNALSTTNPPDFLRFNIRAWQLTNARICWARRASTPC